ncbi:MAG: hypothetical protein SGCHY_003627 [Lobulomycetales sp.]
MHACNDDHPEELLKLLQSPEEAAGLRIVDVRDFDFDRPIVNPSNPTINITKDEFIDDLDQKYFPLLQEEPILVFHCALSQVRGPKCAQRYCVKLRSVHTNPTQKVYILQGGHETFYARYAKEYPELFQ